MEPRGIRWEEASPEGIWLDVRAREAYANGYLPGARHMDLAALREEAPAQRAQRLRDAGWDGRSPAYVYCTRETLAREAAALLAEAGIAGAYLEGGYGNWLAGRLEGEEEKKAQVELSLQKTFKKSLFTPFAKALNQYAMLSPGDKVAVCISGGKDSMLLAKLFQELARHRKFAFEMVFLVMDPGYADCNRRILENNARLLGIPITLFESPIFDAVYEVEKSPCYLCARMRRGYLYSKARELGCNKIALGHHYDDVIETTLMGMLYGAQIQTMMPKLHSTNFQGMELIRPMYLVREEDICRWRDVHGLRFLQCACRFTNTCDMGGDGQGGGSARARTKALIRQLRRENPFVESNIFNSMSNVNLSTVLAYKQDGQWKSFLDTY